MLDTLKFLLMDKAHLEGNLPEDCIGSHVVNFNEGGKGYKAISIEITTNDVDDYKAEKSNYTYCLT